MAASTSFLFVASPATGTRTVYSNTTPLEKKHFQKKNQICQQKEGHQKKHCPTKECPHPRTWPTGDECADVLGRHIS
jgi:hypothetical protein